MGELGVCLGLGFNPGPRVFLGPGVCLRPGVCHGNMLNNNILVGPARLW